MNLLLTRKRRSILVDRRGRIVPLLTTANVYNTEFIIYAQKKKYSC